MKRILQALIGALKPPVYIARGVGPQGIDSRIVAYTDRDSQLAEQYRMMQASLCSLLSRIGEGTAKSIVITSSRSQEGKTVTSCNLAMTLAAHSDKKVVLVDCDLRRPDVHTIFNIDNEPGLSDVIDGKCSLSSIVRSPAFGKLHILPAGTAVSGIYELLRRRGTKDVIDELKSSFDYVIIDTPPVLPVFDSRIVGALCDAVIISVRSGSTSKKTVRDALQMLTAAHARPLGCVLTDFQSPFYQYARYYQYHTTGIREKENKAT